MSGRRAIVPAACAVACLVAACGGTHRQARGPHGRFPVSVSGSFPAAQRLAQQTDLTVTIRNTGHRTIPDVAVTVINPSHPSAQAFGTLIAANLPGQPILASRSRPIWIVDRAPGPCLYSCRHRGPGGAATAYSNTWALGRLRPGHTATFRWRLTAVQAGAHTVEYQVAADLNGYAKAVNSRGKPVHGRFAVRISAVPPTVTVQSDGRVATS